MIQKRLFPVILLIVSTTLIISSCKQEKEKSAVSRSIGNTSEILVVVQNENQWNGKIGKAIRDYFGEAQYGLPQEEPLFKLSHITVNSLNDMFKKHRNLLIVDINPKAEKANVEFVKNHWAKPQRVFKITAPDAGAFIKTFDAYKKRMMQEYNQAERERILTVFRPDNDVKVVEKLTKNFGLKMIIPKGFYVAKEKPGFMWIRKEAVSYSQGLVIISVPYEDTAQFSRKSILARTADYLMKYVPGPTQGSFMSVDMKNMPPKATVVTDFFTDYAVEIRGLWRVEHDFMGGPFVSYTFSDWRKNRIITIFGYVYQPNKAKRNLLKQMEAIIYSVRFYDGKK
jgi:hypothetical protein